MNGNQKLSDDEVRAIRWLCEMGVLQPVIAEQFQCTQAWVSLVSRGHRRQSAGGPTQKQRPRGRRRSK